MGNQRGQALVELGVVFVILLSLALGTLMFGHAFMVLNMATHAARDGARLAASWTGRGACQRITDDTDIKRAVSDRIATVSAQTFAVTVTQDPPASASPPCARPGSTPTVKVNVNGCVPYLFNIWGFGSSGCPQGLFKVDRTVVFDDELRG